MIWRIALWREAAEKPGKIIRAAVTRRLTARNGTDL